MTHAHVHPTTCEHEIKYCAQCDVAYCTKCPKEWGNKVSGTAQQWPFSPYVGTPQPLSGGTGPDIVLCNAIAGETGQRGVFTHRHG